MIICLESSILGGYLSNEVPGLVTGVLHLAGQSQPVRVELVGNFLRDIAGCRVDFHNPLPEVNEKQVDALSPLQHGYSGLMTASYRVAKLPRRRSQGDTTTALPIPPGLKNLLFFEWFNQDQQRVLIQSWHLHLRVSAPRWQLTKEEEAALLRQNRARRKHYLLGKSPNSRSADALHSPGYDDPFQPTKPGCDPFGPAMDESRPPHKKGARAQNSAEKDPVKRSSALAKELRRFQGLLIFNEEVRTRPAVLRLLSTVADLAAHLVHVLRQFAESQKEHWDFLVVDLEQSLPLFAAALNATDKLVQQNPGGADMQWLAGVQASLLNIELRMRELLGLLR
jgi:hypothetical protein|uniref:hypothetical protein n=1 Tax=Prosthecobacter sp. TaxID=1965333 RepID=UPI003784A856